MTEHLFIAIDQPMGRFYATRINASKLIPITQSKERAAYNSTGIQRKLKSDRVNEISDYCNSENAMFPTPIILSGKSEYFEFRSLGGKANLDYSNIDSGYISIDDSRIVENKDYLSIVDGQHRLAGIRQSGKDREFDLLVLFIFDTEAYQDAEIFSTINRNQKQVSKSLVYDLYGLTDVMTVEKFAHEIIATLNSEAISLMQGRVKMLGYKTDDFFSHMNRKPYVSQAALIDELLPLVSPNISQDNRAILKGELLVKNDESRYVLRPYIINDSLFMAQVHLIAFFNAWLRYLEELGYQESILFKTVGFIVSFGVFQKIFCFVTDSNEENRLSEIYSGYMYSDDSELANNLIVEYEHKYRLYLEKLNFNEIEVGSISSSRSGAAKLIKKLLSSLSD